VLDQILTRLEVLVAAAALVGFGKSFYNGFLRRLARAVREIPHIASRVEDLNDKQDDLTDAVVAVALAQSSKRKSVDPDSVVDGLRDDEGAGRFLRDENTFRRDGGKSMDVEEEREEEVEES
jgi:predicted transcriptional regulator